MRSYFAGAESLSGEALRSCWLLSVGTICSVLSYRDVRSSSRVFLIFSVVDS